MIVFELICSANHRFEGWFASADDFTSQKERGLLACPRCSDKSIEKLLTAKIGRSGADELAAPTAGKRQEAALATGQHLQAKLQELIDHVLAHTENVGAAFAEEARKIHYEEAERRDIRGTATGEEIEELIDEGISVIPLPVPGPGEWH